MYPTPIADLQLLFVEWLDQIGGGFCHDDQIPPEAVRFPAFDTVHIDLQSATYPNERISCAAPEEVWVTVRRRTGTTWWRADTTGVFWRTWVFNATYVHLCWGANTSSGSWLWPLSKDMKIAAAVIIASLDNKMLSIWTLKYWIRVIASNLPMSRHHSPASGPGSPIPVCLRWTYLRKLGGKEAKHFNAIHVNLGSPWLTTINQS